MDEKIESLERAARAIARADALLIGAGAGMGVDSGIPDYRGSDGFWTKNPGYEGLEMGRWFIDDYDSARAVMDSKHSVFRRAIPHAGYHALLALGARMPRGTFVYTSNVDGHFERAGFHPHSIIECHGASDHAQCVTMCTRRTWPAEDPGGGEAPRCPECGGLARPNVLLFGDNYWTSSRYAEQKERYMRWRESLAGARLAVLEIGAGQTIPSVREQCELVVERFDGVHVRVNPHEADIERGIGVAMGACAALTQLAERVRLIVTSRRP